MSAPYRDEEHALRQRLASLDEDRKRLDAERAEVSERLNAIGEPFSLESLRIASPCKADWGAMQGDDRVRFCGQCEKNVYNLSGMRRDEADALIQGAEGKVCIRMYRRADGTVLTSDCPDGVRRKRRRRLAIVAGSGVFAAASATAFASFTTTMGAPMPRATMGAIEAVTPPDAPDGARRGDPSQNDTTATPAGDPKGEKASTAGQTDHPTVLMGAPMPLPKRTPVTPHTARKGQNAAR
jgi:hypothetical protein